MFKICMKSTNGDDGYVWSGSDLALAEFTIQRRSTVTTVLVVPEEGRKEVEELGVASLFLSPFYYVFFFGGGGRVQDGNGEREKGVYSTVDLISSSECIFPPKLGLGWLVPSLHCALGGRMRWKLEVPRVLAGQGRRRRRETINYTHTPAFPNKIRCTSTTEILNFFFGGGGTSIP